jgi:hypothetical protein
VWADVSQDGIRDPKELGLSGIQVDLYHGSGGCNGSNVATTTTDASGNYLFSAVGPGVAYYLFAAELTGSLLSPEYQGNDTTLDSDVDATGCSAPLVLARGQHFSVDAGLSGNE